MESAGFSEASADPQVNPSLLLLQEEGAEKADDQEVLPREGQVFINKMTAEVEPQIRRLLWSSFLLRWKGILTALEDRRYRIAAGHE